MQIPLKVNKVYFFDINHGLTMTLWKKFPKSKNYAIPMYGLQYPWSRRAMDKGKIKAMVTKFSEKFAIIMLKKHRKFFRCGLTHLDATSIFKKIVQILMGHPVILQELFKNYAAICLHIKNTKHIRFNSEFFLLSSSDYLWAHIGKN